MSLRRRWTPDEDRVIRAEYRTLDVTELARRFNRSVGAVYVRAWKLRVIKCEWCPSLPRYAERETEVLRLHARGWTDSEIGAKFGVSHDAILKQRKRLGLPSNRRSPRVLARLKRLRRDLCRAGRIGFRAWFRPICEAYHLPPDLRLTQFRILLTLIDGPRTKQCLLWRLGIRCGCDKGALAGLIRRGLVLRIDFSGRGMPRGRRPLPLYTLTPHAMDLLSAAGDPTRDPQHPPPERLDRAGSPAGGGRGAAVPRPTPRGDGG